MSDQPWYKQGPYWVPDEDDEGELTYGDLLVGPDGFECYLGEPEDRCWYRDGKNVIKELNRLHARVKELEAWINDRPAAP